MDRKHRLQEFTQELIAAKSHIFRMEDIAQELDDYELMDRVRSVRAHIENADNRAISIWHGEELAR